MSAQAEGTVESIPQVPDTNVTSLGLYVTPQEAYTLWKTEPEQVNIVDVRTFEEYIFVGHLEMARNVPLVFPKYHEPEEGEEQATPGGRPPGCYGEFNPDFASTVKEYFAPGDTILVYCATGGRGAMAINLLAEAGFKQVYNIINGLEGDRVDDPGSVYHGKHMRNGWKNAGLPWGYAYHPDLMWETD
jgi:rhodanese-related sulfurtransferase